MKKRKKISTAKQEKLSKERKFPYASLDLVNPMEKQSYRKLQTTEPKTCGCLFVTLHLPIRTYSSQIPKTAVHWQYSQ